MNELARRTGAALVALALGCHGAAPAPEPAGHSAMTIVQYPPGAPVSHTPAPNEVDGHPSSF